MIKYHKYVIFIVLDLKKAFDCVSHKILLNKLYKIGFRGNIHSLLESYLHDRYQCVNIENFKSQYARVKFGVPQGSILGPILFLLFINDIVTLDCDFVSLFADDAVLEVKGESFPELLSKLQTLILSLPDWLSANKLLPNTTKTVLMLFSPFKIQRPLPDLS